MPEVPDRFVLLERAPNPAIAGLWASMLEAAGIQAYLPGTNLADEFAATQRIVGNIGADVFVPRSRLEEARNIVARSEPEHESDEDSDAVDDTDEIVEPVATAELEQAEERAPSLTRREIIFEIIAVACVVVLPPYLFALSGLVERDFRPWRDGTWDLHDAVVDGIHAILIIVLLRWVISRTGEPASNFGWVRFRPVRDVLLGAAVFVGFVLVTGFAVYLTPEFSRNADSAAEQFVLGVSHRGGTLPSGPFEWLILVGSTFALALVEELSIRGYLMIRLRTLLGSAKQAAIISSFVWAGCHVYQGLVPAGLHFVDGLFLAWVFFKLKRIWPLAIAHAGMNVFITLGRA